MTETTVDPSEDLFPGKSDDEVAALARAFVLSEHEAEMDGDEESHEPLGYEP